ncbi:MAG: hypothetical protein AVDCRST_MAG14-7 [uncultured Rubrobacteraceae bacterium]|uniref:Uncharacterized protein n=1 Tax=uncultured Rubrobacteraceae bacterium TaxID=349277 RepID=A0A6J4QMP1_9ACTN|nr:MAG: hypothetical protein AVDCRST_MAG14-7 [uncultured Rubrobacteraceae bacterium]
MSSHWRLVARNTAWIIALAIPVGAAIFYIYSEAHAGGFLYGVGTGVLSLVSMALTVSLLTGRSRVVRVIGAVSFVVRYGFVMLILGVPAYLGLWPVVGMLGGFAGVYLLENVILLPGMMRAVGEARV